MSKSESSKEETKQKEKDYPLRVAFIHPDLGISRAEQLTYYFKPHNYLTVYTL